MPRPDRAGHHHRHWRQRRCQRCVGALGAALVLLAVVGVSVVVWQRTATSPHALADATPQLVLTRTGEVQVDLQPAAVTLSSGGGAAAGAASTALAADTRGHGAELPPERICRVLHYRPREGSLHNVHVWLFGTGNTPAGASHDFRRELGCRLQLHPRVSERHPFESFRVVLFKVPFRTFTASELPPKAPGQRWVAIVRETAAQHPDCDERRLREELHMDWIFSRRSTADW